VSKLAGMMRYVFNDSEKNFVPLQDEIAYIHNYIELQQVRFGNSVALSLDVSGNTNAKKIAPLILIPFIENAFKHGVNAEENSVIRINIHISEKDLHLQVLITK